MVAAVNTFVTLTLSAFDPEGGVVRNFVKNQPDHGALSIFGDQVIYTPGNNFNGTDAFTLVSIDYEGAATEASFDVTVGGPLNKNPTISADSQVVENGAQISFPFNATGENVQLKVAALYGEATASNNLITYRAPTGMTGRDQVSIEGVDSDGNKVIKIVEITLRPPLITSVKAYDGNPANGGAQIAVSNSDYGPGAFTINTMGLSDGNHSFYFVATDAFGSQGISIWNGKVDNTRPDLYWKRPSTPKEADFVAGTITLDVTATDASGINAVYVIDPSNEKNIIKLLRINGTNDFETTYNTLQLAAGSHLFEAFAVDEAKNESLHIQLHVTVDNNAPRANISYAPALIDYDNGSVVKHLIRAKEDISVAASDLAGVGVDTIELLFDGVLMRNISAASLNYLQFNTAAKSEGDHVFSAIVVDKLGNSSKTDSTITIDNTLPTVKILSPTNGTSILNALTSFSADVTDSNGIATYAVLVDGKDVSTTKVGKVYRFASAVSSLGAHTIKMVATDTVGNKATDSVEVSILTSNGAPLLEFTQLSDGSSIGGNYMLEATVTGDNLSDVFFRVNGGAVLPATAGPNHSYTFPLDTHQFTNGPIVIELVAKDTSGATASVSANVIVDNAAPVITSATPAEGDNVSGLVGINIAATDNNRLGKVDILIDGVNVHSKASSSGNSNTINYSLNSATLSNGAHNIQFSVTDAAGNVTNQTNRIIVRNAGPSAPGVTILGLSEGAFIGQIQGLHFETSGLVTSAGFRVDGGSLIAGVSSKPNDYTYNLNTTQLSDGPHTITYEASNNVGTTVRTIHVVVDNSLPSLTVVRPTDNQILGGVTNIVANTADNSLASVQFSINMDPTPLAFFSANPDPANNTYSYALDTWAVDANGNRRFIDGQSYIFTVTTCDKAGNCTHVDKSVTIDNLNVPLSKGTLSFSPTSSCVVGSAGLVISATVANAVIEPISIVGRNAFRVYADKDGLSSQVPGSARLVGNTLNFVPVTSIPDNSIITAAVDVSDTEGNVIRGTHSFKDLMNPALGGQTTLLPENLVRLSLPAGSFAEPALFTISKLDPNAQGLLEANLASERLSEHSEVVIYGPVSIRGTTCSGALITTLEVPAQIVFQRDLSTIPQAERDMFVDQFQVLDSEKIFWRPIATSLLNASSTIGSRTVSVPTQHLGAFRVTSFAVPGPGISELFNYPNPFSPSEGGTDFSYLLGEDSDVHVAIYDLLGNLVRNVEISRGNRGGKLGQNLLHWDGRNGAGDTVGNGGYIAQFMTTDSQGRNSRTRRKVGVAK